VLSFDSPDFPENKFENTSVTGSAGSSETETLAIGDFFCAGGDGGFGATGGFADTFGRGAAFDTPESFPVKGLNIEF
jgi:hypothetical protein